jgi:dihydropteroate synthase
LSHTHPYKNVVTEVLDELGSAVSKARSAGVRSIVVDPGFGFGKNPHDNLRLIDSTDRIAQIGVPVMIGVSRKSTIGTILADHGGSTDQPVPTSDRLYGSLGAAAVGVLKGATLVRTHDVRETVEMVRLIGETVASGRTPADG